MEQRLEYSHATKCHACHAQRHDNFLRHLEEEQILQLPHSYCEARGNARLLVTPRNRHVSAASPIGTAHPEQSQEQNTRHMQASKRAFRARLPPILTRVTKCHACHGICTWLPLRAAVPMRFAKNTQHDTSEVLRLPRKIESDTSKVLRLPRKMTRML